MTGSLRVEFRVPPAHPSLPGHFPGHPIVPGVVILDEVLRALEHVWPRQFKITGAPSIKFLAPLFPGETAAVQFDPGFGTTLRFTVTRASTVLASGQWTVTAP